MLHLEQGDSGDSPPITLESFRTTLGLTMLFQKAIAMPSGSGAAVINESMVYRSGMVLHSP